MGSYDREKFVANGIEHLDAPVSDELGAVPPKDVVARVGNACQSRVENGEAIVFHCKSGFGRSLVFACYVTNLCLKIPGSTLLAWARLTRPGAITTPEQERFVQ